MALMSVPSEPSGHTPETEHRHHWKPQTHNTQDLVTSTSQKETTFSLGSRIQGEEDAHFQLLLLSASWSSLAWASLEKLCIVPYSFAELPASVGARLGTMAEYQLPWL